MVEVALPCPFCGFEIDPNGSDDIIWWFRGGGPPPSYAVRCDGCGAQGPYGDGASRGDHDGAKDEAIRAWNDRRAQPQTGDRT